MLEVSPLTQAVPCPKADHRSLLLPSQELINAIHVFVIRVVEKRIDGVLDAALLDYESMSEEFGDVAFEGEWNFLKSLTGRGTTNAKKVASRIVPKAKDVFGATSSPRGSIDFDAIARDGFGSMRESSHGGRASMDLSSSKDSSNGRPLSMADFRSTGGRSQQGPATPTTLLFSSTSSSNQAPPIGIDVSSSTSAASATPRTITSFLTLVLVVLQLYEVNPAITCQAFSQVYYWVACEAFNRILTRKKYLCRSKAIQIKMNLTALEDWVRDRYLLLFHRFRSSLVDADCTSSSQRPADPNRHATPRAGQSTPPVAANVL